MRVPFSNYKELYLHSNYKVALTDGSSNVARLKTGNDIEQKIYQERLILVSNMDHGLQKALDEDVAFLNTTNILVGKNCSYSKIPQCLRASMAGWAVRKDFPYKGFIDYK